jgi:hypothetical protein
VAMMRRRRQVEDQQPLGPEDDPYLAYLAWREERDAKAVDEDELDPEHDHARAADHASAGVSAHPSWLRRFTVWRRHDDQR